MNYPFNNQQNLQKSEILISISRQELKNLDFDPKKPENFYKQYNNNSNTNNLPQGSPLQQQQLQDDIMNTEKVQCVNSSFHKYYTQEEYHQSIQFNLIQSNNFKNDSFQKNNPLYQPTSSQQFQNSFASNTNSSNYKEGK
ncbi:unnamed protein product [Paramecium primaurelia]|uniref:Uncharacterized protein n=1 Tax=Paramecium primaurelia TaxID=5886 RepID=A0A8S1Q3V4_PARPR|nr:unnamed protein product [Paramecium primaurelia]